MINRREVAVGGLLTIVSSSLACTSHAQTARHTFGCMLADDEAEQILVNQHRTANFCTWQKTDHSEFGRQRI